MAANEAGEYWRDDGGNVRVDQETFIVQQGGRNMHRLSQHKEILQTVGDFLGDEVNEVRNELVKTGICADAG